MADVVMLPRGPGKPRGYAKTGGRQKGSKNRRTVEVEEAVNPLVPAAKRKLKALLGSGDEKVALAAAQLVLAYRWGRPIDRTVNTNTNENTHAFTSPEDRAQAAEEWKALIADFRAPAPTTGQRAAFQAALKEPEPEPLKVGDTIDAGFGIAATVTEFTEHNSPVWRTERGGKFLRVVYGAPDRVRGWAEALADEEGWA